MEYNSRLLVTGGAGFIGSNFILQVLDKEKDAVIINYDKLTYAGNKSNLFSIEKSERYRFIQGDICDQEALSALFSVHRPTAIVHFAAESHVDRSIHSPAPFVETNIVGTYTLLNAALDYWKELKGSEKENFRFLHISTDEVYGSLEAEAPPSDEESAFAPNSPYAASKAAADCAARAYFRTYGLPVIIARSSNNFGPYQFPEKLIPLTLLNAMTGKNIPVYGDGRQLRNWIFVEDHCRALRLLLEKGSIGDCYNIAAEGEQENLEVVKIICEVVGASYSLITHVEDRPGHDRRYALNASKLRGMGWRPQRSFSENLQATIAWYLENRQWLMPLVTEDYRRWLNLNYKGTV